MAGNEKNFEILDSSNGKRRAVKTVLLCVALAAVIFLAVVLIVRLKRNSSDETRESGQEVTTAENTRKSYSEDGKTDKEETVSQSTASEDVTEDAETKAEEENGEPSQSSSDSGSGGAETSYGKKNLDPESSQPVMKTDSHKEDWENRWTDSEEETEKVLQEEAENTGVGITYAELIESLGKQIRAKQDFIANHYGWPEDMGDGGQYDGVREYIDSIHRSFLTGVIDYNADGKGLYGEEPETLQRQLLYHLFREQQYYTGYADCPEATSIYFKWAEFGLADIGKIESIRILPYQFPVDCEDYTICMEIRAETENGSYIIYVGDMDVLDERMYVIMDIEQVSVSGD